LSYNAGIMRRLSRVLARSAIIAVVLLIVAVIVAPRWPQRMPRYTSEVGAQLSFERVAEPGFGPAGRLRLADSAWSMRYFRADGAADGYLYVGTDNNIVGLAMAILYRPRAAQSTEERPVQPPQIWRYRPERGAMVWEPVLDLAAHESAPYLTEGFRAMAIYRARSDGRTYLYAGTMAEHSPSLWRTASGDPGSWERGFVFPATDDPPLGSIRGLAVHDDGLLYISLTASGDILPGGTGQIWATDGAAVFPVVTDGFGNPDNIGIASLASYGGCLYAGTYNGAHGYEVWKLRCVDDPGAPPQAVIVGGAGQRRMETAMSMRVFQGQLYVGTGIPMGFNPVTRHGPRGCNVVRINQDDEWESVVGRRRTHPLSQHGAGFGWYMNAYCWYMEEHKGYLYLGTFDLSRTVALLGESARSVAPRFRPLLDYLAVRPQGWGSPMGGDLYRTADGVHWEPVFLDGLGDPDNHGIRTLESTPMGLFVGTENPFTRLEVWRLE
jgi:hypothetical protein